MYAQNKSFEYLNDFLLLCLASTPEWICILTKPHQRCIRLNETLSYIRSRPISSSVAASLTRKTKCLFKMKGMTTPRFSENLR